MTTDHQVSDHQVSGQDFPWIVTVQITEKSWAYLFFKAHPPTNANVWASLFSKAQLANLPDRSNVVSFRGQEFFLSQFCSITTVDAKCSYTVVGQVAEALNIYSTEKVAIFSHKPFCLPNL